MTELAYYDEGFTSLLDKMGIAGEMQMEFFARPDCFRWERRCRTFYLQFMRGAMADAG